MPSLKGTETRHITVDVSKKDIWEEMVKVVHENAQFPGEYVNYRKNWEIDYGGHGSGHKVEKRPVTKEELDLLEAIKLVRKFYFNE